MDRNAQARKNLEQLIEASSTETMKSLSLSCGRSHTYIRDFIVNGSPRRLPETVRAKLVELLDTTDAVLIGEMTVEETKAHQRIASKSSEFTKTLALNSPLLPNNMIKLDELNVAAAGGDGAIMDEYEDIRHSWVVPRELVDPVTQSPAERIKIITVIGDSMYPEYTAGMKVMVDTNHRVPSPPGVYVIWDGFAQYIKRLDLYRDEEGTNKVQIISANPDYPTRTMNLDDLHVNGRVIGKWTWT